jgi:hypothetical protein
MKAATRVGRHHPDGMNPEVAARFHPVGVMPADAARGTVAPTQQHAKEDLQMADEVSQYRSASRAREATSGWAVGFILFAAVMMIMAGIWQALAGLIAIFQNEFYVTTRNYLFQFDATTWGWIHLLIGVLVALAGVGLLGGRTWARVVGITLAALSATANFLFIPYYPFWSLLIIALDVFIIWALAAHGRELREARY